MRPLHRLPDPGLWLSTLKSQHLTTNNNIIITIIMTTTQQLARAIAQKKQLITDTAAQAEEIERRAEALPPKERGSLNDTAALLRSRLPALLTALHELEDQMPEPTPIRVVTLECLINRCNGNDTGLFAHETTPRVSEEMRHHWEAAA